MEDDIFISRTASNEDIPRIVGLVKRNLAEFGLTYSPETSESDLLDIESVYLKNGGTFLVIEKKSQIIGTVALLRVNESTAKLRKMYVDQEYRNLGFGKKLTDKIVEKAIDFGFKEIILETVHTMVAAIQLYESRGFKHVENSVASSPRCDIVMCKKLQYI